MPNLPVSTGDIIALYPRFVEKPSLKNFSVIDVLVDVMIPGTVVPHTFLITGELVESPGKYTSRYQI